jgi:cystathionine beta-lyase
MSFDFDTPPDRRGTDSQKWLRYAGRDVLPMWVADMDFASPPAVIEALHRRVEHGVFGYARPIASTVEAVVGALDLRYGWRIDPSWMVWLPGLVSGLSAAIDAFSEPGDEVLCLTPVYPPFMRSARNRGRVSVKVPLALSEAGGRVEGLTLTPPGTWTIDWDALERAITPRSRILILCHPHNPVGRVWSRDELLRVADFCARHGLTLFSDEIHCDLMLDGGSHLPTASLAPEIAARTVTFMAPSKTYNLPGLGTSIAILPDGNLRARLVRAAADIVPEVNALGYVACEAAYRDGEPWRQSLLAYLRGNRDLILDFVARELPGIRIDAPIQATYLAWLNVEKLGLPAPAAHFEVHGVGLSDGAPFGVAPGRAVRLNFGCPRSTLVEALGRMKSAVAACQ